MSEQRSGDENDSETAERRVDSATRSDADGDGLWDDWESNGVDGTDLPTLGADPNRRDIFVEMDWMVRPDGSATLKPSTAVIDAIVAAFAAAPVTNPDGSTGIALHLVWGNEVPYQENMNKLAFLLTYKAHHFDIDKRAAAFHYMIWADGWGDAGDTTSGMSIGTPSSDFVVTLGRWNGGAGGDESAQIGTFIHELGHNLGLQHGSGDDVEEKPNHLSVMNYTWQTTGLRKNGSFGHFTYQWLPLLDLHEGSLDESAGIGSDPSLKDYETAWYGPGGAVMTGSAFPPINWDGLSVPSPVQVDLTAKDGLTPLAGGLDEWNRLKYTGGTIGSGASRSELRRQALEQERGPMPAELSENRALRIRRSLRFPGR